MSAHNLRPIRRLQNLGLLGPGLIAVHAVHLIAEEIELLAEHGCHVAHCPSSNLKLASGIAPVRQLRTKGVNVGIGTDGVACSRAFLDLNIPAVFVTGSREEAFASRDVAIGYLCKPCDPERVGAAVRVLEKVIAGEFEPRQLRH